MNTRERSQKKDRAMIDCTTKMSKLKISQKQLTVNSRGGSSKAPDECSENPSNNLPGPLDYRKRRINCTGNRINRKPSLPTEPARRPRDKRSQRHLLCRERLNFGDMSKSQSSLSIHTSKRNPMANSSAKRRSQSPVPLYTRRLRSVTTAAASCSQATAAASSTVFNANTRRTPPRARNRRTLTAEKSQGSFNGLKKQSSMKW